MYIVTSKPKRISVNSGLVHIVFSRIIRLIARGEIAPLLVNPINLGARDPSNWATRYSESVKSKL
jgi:hypothetical protein